MANDVDKFVTPAGRIGLLRLAFSTPDVTQSLFQYMGAGTASGTFNKITDTQLGSECGQGNTGYQRVPISTDWYPDSTSVKLTGTFGTANIADASPAYITEVGITDTQTPLSQGTWFCLCKIPQSIKTNETQLRVVVTVEMLGE